MEGKRKTVAVVGSRRMSPYGKKIIEKAVPELINLGFGVICLDIRGCGELVKKVGGERVETVPVGRGGFEQAHEILASKADVVLVVEGGENSGTILAALAFWNKDKEVWAVPGRIDDEQSTAPNWLLQYGARIFLGEVDEIGTTDGILGHVN